MRKKESVDWKEDMRMEEPSFEPGEGWKAIKRVYTYNATDNVETYMVVDRQKF